MYRSLMCMFVLAVHVIAMDTAPGFGKLASRVLELYGRVVDMEAFAQHFIQSPKNAIAF